VNLEESEYINSEIEELSMSSKLNSTTQSESLKIEEDCYFELPDETLIKIDKSLQYQWGEAVITPSILQKQNGYFLPDLLNLVDCFKNHSDFFLDHKQNLLSLHEYLFKSIEMCDTDFQKMFNGNILVTGGVSNTRGLFEKFKTVRAFFIY
jgi:actin-related protein